MGTMKVLKTMDDGLTFFEQGFVSLKQLFATNAVTIGHFSQATI